MTRRPQPLVANPVLVGAVTLLVTVVGVLIAYNANQGLPFVPTYKVRVELPSAAKLVVGNEARLGGFRVGVVESIEHGVRRIRGRRKAVAVVGLKLDEQVEPLSADSVARVRPRSPLGLKYVELTPGRSRKKVPEDGTLRLAGGTEPLEIEDIFETFTPEARRHARQQLEGLGDALAGRGGSVNAAVAGLSPLLRRLRPVMETLSDRGTGLDRLIRGLGGTSSELAAATPEGSALAASGAETFEALGREPAALQATLEELPPTLGSGTRSLRATRPFLVELADLSRRLRPAAAELPRSLPPLTSAFRVGAPVLRRSTALSERLEGAARGLRDLMRNPSTLMSLRDLRTALRILRPAVEFIAPYQTVCNYTVYFLHALGEHQSQRAPGGTVQQQLLKFVNPRQPNTQANTFSARPWDLPPGEPAQGATFDGLPAGRTLVPPYQPAIDAQGNADCQNGQLGYPNWRLVEPFVPVRPETVGTLPDGTPKGANAPVAINDYPILSGGTYKSRELGIDNLRDVP